MITLKLQGGLGNQLFQYCSARILAENSNLFFYAPRIEGFNQIKSVHKGKIIAGGLQKIVGHSLPDLVNRRTLLEGYFQRIELLDTQKSKVVNWLQLDNIVPNHESDERDITLSIRRGSSGWPIELCPTVEYYMDLLKKFEFRKLWITTDSPSDEYFAPLLKAFPSARIVHLGTLGQFKFIQNSKRIIVAPSSFSVIAAWSSEAENIYWPKIEALNFDHTDHNWFSRIDQRNEYIGIAG